MDTPQEQVGYVCLSIGIAPASSVTVYVTGKVPSTVGVPEITPRLDRRAPGAGDRPVARERSVVWKHALRNALLPVTTLVGLQLGFLVGGAVLTETIANHGEPYSISVLLPPLAVLMLRAQNS